MKRKREPPTKTPVEEMVVPAVLLEEAKRAIDSDRFHKLAACVVCKGECPANAVEGLCWVCRRLKMSAWRDSDTQVPAQE